jgi:hypothetical protein
LSETATAVSEQGLRGVADSAFYLYVGLWLTLTSRRPVGHNIFSDEWDLLVVLDACRVDALAAVAPEYDFLSDVGERWSVGSTSIEWIANTFTESYADEAAETAYITANHFSDAAFSTREFPPYGEDLPPFGRAVPVAWPSWRTVRSEDLCELEEVWRYGRDDEASTVPPRVVSDTVIEAGRDSRCDRVVAHYMQPHDPYIGSDTLNSPGELYRLNDGDVSRDELWDAYIDTLRLVLDDVELLLENYDAETVVITADHGEAFGEWGSAAHTIAFPHPAVRKVPWVVTTATDEHTHEPGEYERDVESFDKDQHLADLGYFRTTACSRDLN